MRTWKIYTVQQLRPWGSPWERPGKVRSSRLRAMTSLQPRSSPRQVWKSGHRASNFSLTQIQLCKRELISQSFPCLISPPVNAAIFVFLYNFTPKILGKNNFSNILPRQAVQEMAREHLPPEPRIPAQYQVTSGPHPPPVSTDTGCAQSAWGAINPELTSHFSVP